MLKKMTSSKLFKPFWLLLYYGFARHLPRSGRYTVCCKKLRGWICGHLFKSAGININIEAGAYFGAGSQIEIGDNSGIGLNCSVNGTVKIGDNVMMAPDVIIHTVNHKFDRIDIPMRQQGSDVENPVTICDDVWIGTRAIILPGVTIGKSVIIGAGAIVTKDVPEYAIACGNPAKVIRFRNDSHG